MESALWFHGVITRAIYLLRNTTGSFTCEWDFSACDPLHGIITSGHLWLMGSDFLIILILLGGISVLLFNHVGIIHPYHVEVLARFCTQWEQWWHSAESTHLPPMWRGSDFQSLCHMWVEFVGSLLYSERSYPEYSGHPLSSKTYICLDLTCTRPYRLGALKPIVFK